MRAEKGKRILKESQAYRIITKLGGVPHLCELFVLIGRPKHRISIYRWMYPKSVGGTGGHIPTANWPDLLMAARAEGIFLTEAELSPFANKRERKRGIFDD